MRAQGFEYPSRHKAPIVNFLIFGCHLFGYHTGLRNSGIKDHGTDLLCDAKHRLAQAPGNALVNADAWAVVVFDLSALAYMDTPANSYLPCAFAMPARRIRGLILLGKARPS